MKIGLRCGLKGGRSVQPTPSRHLFKDMRKTTAEEDKKEELKRIVGSKPVVDQLITKVGKIKLKPKVIDELKKREEDTKEYVKAMRKKPKTRINFQF